MRYHTNLWSPSGLGFVCDEFVTTRSGDGKRGKAKYLLCAVRKGIVLPDVMKMEGFCVWKTRHCLLVCLPFDKLKWFELLLCVSLSLT